MAVVKVIIVADDSGHVSVEAEGPLRGKAGLLALLDAARELAEQMAPTELCGCDLAGRHRGALSWSVRL